MNLTVDYLPAREQAPLATVAYDCWRSLDGEIAAEFHRLPSGFLVRFVDNADFVLDLAAGTVTCAPVPGNSDAFIADLHFNQILPLAMSHAGHLVLHASSVDIGGRAVGFVGATGRGKSTLAGRMAQAGHAFLTDDGLILDSVAAGYAVRPRRPILRLRPDSEAVLRGRPDVGTPAVPGGFEGAQGDKQHVAAGPDLPFAGEPVPLAALFVLGETLSPSRPEVRPMGQAEALDQLLRHSFMLDVKDAARMRAHFGRLAELAGAIPCYWLDYPRDYLRLPEVVAAVTAHLNQTGARA